ncbi:MAG: sugar transporter substrate-binding protein [Anaerocolumna sp.]|jgi:ABC-type Fe3+-siderophore transport system permease subunit|nr:sugar transporter substrate-binding protein [Anaerocolumna sp.]
MRKRRFTRAKSISIILIMCVLIIIIAVISINFGKMNLSPYEVLMTIWGKGTDKQELIIYEFRLPRIILAILVGIGMGASGTIMQSLLRNDMASPGTLGISSGSGLFVIMYIAIFSAEGVTSRFLLPSLSFVGGITAAALIFILSYRKGRDLSPTGLILTGVALSNGYGALTLLLTLRLNETQMEFAQRWSAGSLWGDDWKYLSILGPWTLLIFAYVFYKSRMLNTLNLGNQTATGLGLFVKKEFLGLSIAAIALSAGSVALGGNFFFVGMICPHMSKKLVGPNHKFLMPASALTGAIIVLLADTITRTVSFGTDIPTGIVITVLSTPYFIYLLAKSN